MSRKDFELIANTLRFTCHLYKNEKMYREAVGHWVNVLTCVNDRFNAIKFKQACGLEVVATN